MNWAVEIEDMTVAYDRHPVLWDVDMKVPQGALAAVPHSYHFRSR